MLVCFEPDTDDLTGELHRPGLQAAPTASRLQRGFARRGGYPDRVPDHIAELRDFRDRPSGAQTQSRRIGKELEAARDAPRRAFADPCGDLAGSTLGLRRMATG